MIVFPTLGYPPVSRWTKAPQRLVGMQSRGKTIILCTIDRLAPEVAIDQMVNDK
jgi:hypothetical protein